MLCCRSTVPGKRIEVTPLLAWTVLVVGFVLPLLHVALSPASGPWRARPGGGCPFGPRTGWLIVVLFLGPIGWLMYVAGRRRRAAAREAGPSSP